jgi:isoleucyl-tRNA synthetase
MLTDDLLDEGLARELINRIQNLRKDAKFLVTDRIEIYFESDSKKVFRAVQHKEEYIKNETLAINLLDEKVDGLILKEIAIDGEIIFIGIKKNEKL